MSAPAAAFKLAEWERSLVLSWSEQRARDAPSELHCVALAAALVHLREQRGEPFVDSECGLPQPAPAHVRHYLRQRQSPFLRARLDSRLKRKQEKEEEEQEEEAGAGERNDGSETHAEPAERAFLDPELEAVRARCRSGPLRAARSLNHIVSTAERLHFLDLCARFVAQLERGEPVFLRDTELCLSSQHGRRRRGNAAASDGGAPVHFAAELAEDMAQTYLTEFYLPCIAAHAGSVEGAQMELFARHVERLLPLLEQRVQERRASSDAEERQQLQALNALGAIGGVQLQSAGITAAQFRAWVRRHHYRRQMDTRWFPFWNVLDGCVHKLYHYGLRGPLFQYALPVLLQDASLFGSARPDALYRRAFAAEPRAGAPLLQLLGNDFALAHRVASQLRAPQPRLWLDALYRYFDGLVLRACESAGGGGGGAPLAQALHASQAAQWREAVHERRRLQQTDDALMRRVVERVDEFHASWTQTADARPRDVMLALSESPAWLEAYALARLKTALTPELLRGAFDLLRTLYRASSLSSSSSSSSSSQHQEPEAEPGEEFSLLRFESQVRRFYDTQLRSYAQRETLLDACCWTLLSSADLQHWLRRLFDAFGGPAATRAQLQQVFALALKELAKWCVANGSQRAA